MRRQITHSISTTGNYENGNTHKVFLRIPWEKGWIKDNVKFYIWKENEQKEIEMYFVRNEEEYACFEAFADLTTCQFDHYYFIYEANGKTEYYTHVKVPEWAMGAVVYQIFPDRFNKGKGRTKEPMPRRRLHENWDEKPIIEPDEQGIPNNDFFGGDCVGVMEKADYIDSLGADILYFNPIFTSQSTHRYDTADYFHSDPYFGTDEEVEEMAKMFHKRGKKIILDAVFNHSGDDSPYFNRYGTYNTVGASQGEKSEYWDYYDKDGSGEFRYWWNFKTLPVWNKNNPQIVNMIAGPDGVIHKWRNVADCWRFDVVEELPEWFVEICAQAEQKEHPNDYLFIGEIWENFMEKKKNYIRHGIHSGMNYYLMDALIRYYKYGDVYKLSNVLGKILTQYPLGTRLTLMNSTSTHDMSRIVEIFGCDVFKYDGKDAWDIDWDRLFEEETNWSKMNEFERNEYIMKNGGSEEEAFDRFKIRWQKEHKMTDEEYEHGKKVMKSYVTVLAFVQGMFTIFYGDEVGMQGIGNLLNRAPYPWGNEDKEVLQFYRELVKSRKSEDFLRKAEMRALAISEEHFVFERYDDNNKAIVIASRVDYETQMDIPKEYENARIVFSTEGNTKKNLAPYGAIVLKK